MRDRFQIDITYLEESENGFKYVLSIIDCFSKWMWAYALKLRDADSVEQSLRKEFREVENPENDYEVAVALLREKQAPVSKEERIKHVAAHQTVIAKKKIKRVSS